VSHVPTTRERISQHPLTRGLAEPHLDALAACAGELRVPAGAFLMREGQPADASYLVISGRVALEIHAPGHGEAPLTTVGPGGAIGWSWLIAPHRWHFDGVVREEALLVRLDGVCLRERCERECSLGWAVARRFMKLMQDRIERLRLQHLDVYRHPTGGGRLP
jgi:CRP-like cAMP-binding protein